MDASCGYQWMANGVACENGTQVKNLDTFGKGVCYCTGNRCNSYASLQWLAKPKKEVPSYTSTPKPPTTLPPATTKHTQKATTPKIPEPADMTRPHKIPPPSIPTTTKVPPTPFKYPTKSQSLPIPNPTIPPRDVLNEIKDQLLGKHTPFPVDPSVFPFPTNPTEEDQGMEKKKERDGGFVDPYYSNRIANIASRKCQNWLAIMTTATFMATRTFFDCK